MIFNCSLLRHYKLEMVQNRSIETGRENDITCTGSKEEASKMAEPEFSLEIRLGSSKLTVRVGFTCFMGV